MADPSTIAGLVWRVEAKDTTGLSAGDPVASAVAATGPNAVQATSAKRPTWQPNIFGTRPALLFDGTDDTLNSQAAVHSGPTFTMALVVKNLLTGTTRLIYERSPNANANPGSYLSASTGSTVSVGGTTSFSNVVAKEAAAGASWLDTSPHVLIQSCDSTAAGLLLWKDGASVALTTTASGDPGTSNAGATAAAYLGGRNATSFFYQGYIGAVFLFNRVLTSGDRAVLDTYVQDTYAISTADYVASSPTATGTGTVRLGLALSAAGSRAHTGGGTLHLGLTLTASGARRQAGAGTLPLSLAVNAAGTRSQAGAGTLGLSLHPITVGARSHAATGTVGLGLHLQASSTAATPTGVGTVGLGLGLAANGVRGHDGAGTVRLGLGVTATGQRAHVGAGALRLALHLTGGPGPTARDLDIALGRPYPTAWTAGPITTAWATGTITDG